MSLCMHSYAQKKESNSTETISFDFSKQDSLTKGTVTVIGHSRDKAFYEKKLKQAKKEKIVGIVLSCLGGAAIAGTVGGYYAIKNKNNYSSFENRALVLQVGIGSSIAFLATGIPLSIVGSVKEKKYRKKLKSF